MLVIGLTGGMASGKSTFSRVWESLGAFVVNADNLAKSLMAENEGVKSALIASFGSDTYDSNGQLNRAYLAEEAFSKGRVKELNAIVHPAVNSAMKQLINEAKGQNKSIFLYEAAILLQKGRPENFDYIIWVESEKKAQLSRAIKRSNISTIEVEKRLHLQQSLLEVKDIVDKIVYNSASIESFMDEATTLFHQFAAKTT